MSTLMTATEDESATTIRAARLIAGTGRISAEELARRMNFSRAFQAVDLLKELKKLGMVQLPDGIAAPSGTTAYEVLIDADALDAWLVEMGLVAADEASRTDRTTESSIAGDHVEVADQADHPPKQADCRDGAAATAVSTTTANKGSRDIRQGDKAKKPTSTKMPWEGQQATTQQLTLNQITVDEALQCRKTTDMDIVDEYAAAMEEKVAFPPIVVFHDGDTYWLADGFHRHAAAIKADIEQIEARIYRGSRRDAQLYAAGANAQHGLRRSREDVRYAIRLLLMDDEWGKRTNRWLASVIGAHHETVGRVRVQLESTGEIRQCSTREAQDGRRMKARKDDKHGQAKTSDGETEPETKADLPLVGFEGQSSCVRTSENGDIDGTWIDELADLVGRASRKKLDPIPLANAKAKNELIDRLDQQIRQLQALRDELRNSDTSGRTAA